MAKYKHPTNEKHKARKDLKDYTVDKEVAGMVPNASGEIMPDVPRKDDKEMIDDVENMIPKIKDADRVYVTKQMEDGDPKRPANSLKVFSKNQEEDAEELIHTLAKKDGGYMSQIKKLTKEQKEELARRLIRKQIENFLHETAKPDYLDFDKDGDEEESMKKALKDKEKKVNEQDEEPAGEEGEGQAALADTPEPEPAPEAPAIPADASPAEEPAEEPTEEPAEEPAADETPAAEPTPENRIAKFIQVVEEQPGAFKQMKMVLNVIQKLVNTQEDPKQKISRLGLLKRAIDSLLAKQGADPNQ